MKRVAMILAVILAGGAGAYATTVSMQERPSNEPVQIGVMYQASFCNSRDTPLMDLGLGVSPIYIRVTRELNRGWIEAQYASYPQGLDLVAVAADPYNRNHQPLTARINLSLLCMVKPVTP